MINVALIGMGRIGRVHAGSLVKSGARLRIVCDTRPEVAQDAARQFGTDCSSSPQQVIRDKTIDAVFVCTPARTHIDLVEEALANGKYVFCEKPLDEDLDKARRFVEADPTRAASVMIGFHRRFDVTHQKLREVVASNALGPIEQIIFNSRDPRIESFEVLRNTGGIFRDMMMHDIDQATVLVPEGFVGVFARGSCVVDPVFAKNGDFDSAVATFWTGNGVTCTIVNSRRSSFGFEQSIEVLCSDGTATIKAPGENSLSVRNEAGEHLARPKGHFLERYEDAYLAECRAFLEAIEGEREFPVSAVDGLRALVLAAAADRSAHAGQPVPIKGIEVTREPL
jgi:myo-inositol 2-dehydrogenase/D-chiro-inositol 1-dehydrogenase